MSDAEIGSEILDENGEFDGFIGGGKVIGKLSCIPTAELTDLRRQNAALWAFVAADDAYVKRTFDYDKTDERVKLTRGYTAARAALNEWQPE